MAGFLSGPGQTLPLSPLYPANIAPGGELFPYANEVTLAPGQQVPLPRGRVWVELGGYAVLQFYDPVTTVWRAISSSRTSPVLVDSDGFNWRVANMTGCAVGAIVTTAGSGYAQATTTITPSAGNSTWQPIIGGLISTTVSITAAGGGYTVPPLVYFPPPPLGLGVAATGRAVLSSGTVSSITVVNQGAGYLTAPVPQILPNPLDPAFLAGTITSNATATTTLTGSGTLAAVLCTNAGSSFSTVPSLTVAGAGTSGAATIVPMWTLTGTSITSGGAGYSTNSALTTVGGVPSATPAYLNPAVELTGYIPRPAQIGIAAAGGGTITTIGTIYDGGLFTGTPTLYVAGGGSTAATIAGTLGSTNATCVIQMAG